MGRLFVSWLLAAVAAGALGCGSSELTIPEDGGLLDLQAGARPDLPVSSGDLAGRDGAGGPGCTVTGAACSTGNPGACAGGHQACVDGVSTCVPDATSQSCYTGKSGTAGHGVCHAGVQTCIGGLGPCMDEIRPATVENCFNDDDDDCDDKVNDGCPDTVTLGAPHPLAVIGASTGGSPVSVRCPSGAWVVKADFVYDNGNQVASGVSLSCARPTLIRGSAGYSITLSAASPAPTNFIGYQTTSGSDHIIDCGTQGLVAGWGTGGRSGLYVDAVGMSCATGTINRSAENQLSYSFAPNGIGSYTGFGGGSPFPEELCGSNEVLIGYDTHGGAFLDSLQPVCAPLVTTYK